MSKHQGAVNENWSGLDAHEVFVGCILALETRGVDTLSNVLFVTTRRPTAICCTENAAGLAKRAAVWCIAVTLAILTEVLLTSTPNMLQGWVELDGSCHLGAARGPGTFATAAKVDTLCACDHVHRNRWPDNQW